MKSKLDPWVKHMQEVKRVKSCEECHSSDIVANVVYCDVYPGMTNNVACIDFVGNNNYKLRMKVN